VAGGLACGKFVIIFAESPWLGLRCVNEKTIIHTYDGNDTNANTKGNDMNANADRLPPARLADAPRRHADRVDALRGVFRRMDGNKFRDVKDAYFGVVEGLAILAEELGGETGTQAEMLELTNEIALATAALKIMRKSVIGSAL
jgi:hypothetical protein